MQDRDLDFAGLVEALQDHRRIGDWTHRESMLRPFKKELTALLIGLRHAQITGRNERPFDIPESCDLCGCTLGEAPYVDGGVHRAGMAATMCLPCFSEHGKGIGWGLGQLYAHDGAGWQCIGGGNPEPAGDEE